MNQVKPALILGALIALGMMLAGWILGNSALKIKQYERIVSVKGLSEREVKADVAVWPIRFNAGSQDLAQLYDTMQNNTQEIQTFLKMKVLVPKRSPVPHQVLPINTHSNMAVMPMSHCAIPPARPLPSIPTTLMQSSRRKAVWGLWAEKAFPLLEMILDKEPNIYLPS